MFGVSDIAETLAMHKDRFNTKYVYSSNAVCDTCNVLCRTYVVKLFLSRFHIFSASLSTLTV